VDNLFQRLVSEQTRGVRSGSEFDSADNFLADTSSAAEIKKVLNHGKKSKV
jgi:hypothetical protein